MIKLLSTSVCCIAQLITYNFLLKNLIFNEPNNF